MYLPIANDADTTDRLHRLSIACSFLQLPPRLPQQIIQRVNDQGLQATGPELFTRLRGIASDIGYQTGDCYYRNLSSVSGLFSDFGVSAVLDIVSEQVFAMALEVHLLCLNIPFLSIYSARSTCIALTHLRQDPQLYLPQCSRDHGPCHTPRQVLKSAGHRLNKVRRRMKPSAKHQTPKSVHSDLECIELHGPGYSVVKLIQTAQHSWVPEATIPLDSSGSYKTCSSVTLTNDIDCNIALNADFLRWSGSGRVGAQLLLTEEMKIWEELQAAKIPHIPELISYTYSETEVHIVTESFNGGDVTHWLSSLQEGFPALIEVLYITQILFEFLSSLHAHRYLHRDIKPENILVRLRDEKPPESRKLLTAAITDFGFACKLYKGRDSIKTNCGTIDYLAPEVWHTGRAGRPADIWSAGATLFKVRYGAAWLPFGSRSTDLPRDLADLERYYAIKAGKTVKKLDAFDKLILLMLHPNPRIRPDAPCILKLLSSLRLDFI